MDYTNTRIENNVRKLHINNFIEKANLVHNSFYNYDKFEYNGYKIKGVINCKLHGEFLQEPGNHLSGKGCPSCGLIKFSKSKTSNTQSFIFKSKEIHGNKYDYYLVEYKNAKTKVQITCRKHGLFMQEPKHHLSGIGCPKCSLIVSKLETDWLNKADITKRSVPIVILGKKIIADGFDPKTNTIYEFYGDYWHGNPKIYNSTDINKSNKKTFGYLYRQTILKELLIKNAGYKLITIWESEFKKVIG